MTDCQIRGCRHIETKCADCGRLVMDRVLPTNDEWIDVNDHLPNDKDHMVLAADCNDKYSVMALVKYVEGFWWIESQIEDVRDLKPTHWMRLPKPPEEVKNKVKMNEKT